MSKYTPKRPLRPLQVRWREPLGKSECPYMYRWVFNLYFFSIRIHKWLRSDDKRYFHDHPWWFWTLVLKGSYTDVSPQGEDKLKAGSVRYRPSRYRHYVDVPETGALTILITGRQSRNWGFWIHDKVRNSFIFRRPFKYFHNYGHPPCDEQ